MAPALVAWSKQNHREFPVGAFTLRLETLQLSKLVRDEGFILQLPEGHLSHFDMKPVRPREEIERNVMKRRKAQA